jgi:DMSO/TMAO reductase YedYZ heme-binding membrane subunit
VSTKVIRVRVFTDIGSTYRWGRVVGICFAAGLAYATVRYHVFSGVAWSQFPLFIFNKAVSFAAAALLAASYLAHDRDIAKRIGLAGFALALLHVFMSNTLLGPANYPKLYVAGTFTLSGGICMLGGCVALLLLLAPAFTSVPVVQEGMRAADWRRWQRAGLWALGAGAVHVAALGWQGWLQPTTWPGGLPPITLLSFALFAAPLALRLRRS